MSDFSSLTTDIKNWDINSDQKLFERVDRFVNNLISQCDKIQKETINTEYEANSISVHLQDTFNSLSNLSNRKFIESSVATAEETPTTKPNEDLTIKPNLSAEQKVVKYAQTIKIAFDLMKLTPDDDESMLTKQNTMSLTNMFKAAEGLPLIIGSRAFEKDEFFGILDKSPEVDDYFKYGSSPKKDSIAQSEKKFSSIDVNPVGNSTQQPVNNFSQTQVSQNSTYQPTQTLSNPVPNMQVNQNNSFLPPPKLDLLLNTNPSRSESKLEPPKIDLLQPLQQKPIQQQQQQPTQQAIPTLLAPLNSQKIDSIKNDPMYTQQPQKKSNLFEDDVEVGNEDLFKPSNKNKDKFSNLFNPTASFSNPFANANPFDPFGLNLNPLNPLNPTPLQKAPSANNKEDALLKAANSDLAFEDKKPVQQQEPKSKLKNLFNESDSDDESRLNKQKQLTSMYKKEEISPPKQTITTNVAAPKTSKLFDDDDDGPFSSPSKPQLNKTPSQQSTQSNNTNQTRKSEVSKVEEEIKPIQQIKPVPAKKGLFDGDLSSDDDDKPIVKPLPKQQLQKTQTLTQPSNPAPKKGLFDGDDDDNDPLAKPIASTRPSTKPAENRTSIQPKKALFGADDEDNDPLAKPIGQNRGSIKPADNRPSAQPKKNLFGGNDEEDDPLSKPIQQITQTRESIKPADNRPSAQPKKNLFGGDDEEDDPLSKPIQQTTQTRESIKPSTETRPSAQPKKNLFGGVDEEDQPLSNPVASNRQSVQPVPQQEELKEEPQVQQDQEPKKDAPIFAPKPSFKKKVETSSSEESDNEVKPKKAGGGLNLKALEEQLKQNEQGLNQSQNRPSNMKVSSRISQLQEKLNLNNDILKPHEETLAPWRKTKGPEDAPKETEENKPEQIEGQQDQPTQELPQQIAEVIQEPPQEVQKQNSKADELFKNLGPMTTSVANFQPISEQSQSMQPLEPIDESQNPLNLLKGLKNIDERKSNVKFKLDEPSVQPKLTKDNPLALLSGLKEMDAEKGRKSTKKRDLFDDLDEKKSNSKLFEEDDGIFKPKETGPDMKIFDNKPKTIASRQSEGKKLNNLFAESDEDDPLSKKPANTSNKALPQRKAKSKLFDDDD